MVGFKRRLRCDDFAFVALSGVVQDFLSATAKASGEPLQTYSLFDGAGHVSFNNLDDIAPLYDRYDIRTANVDGADGSNLMITIREDSVEYSVSGSAALIAVVKASVENNIRSGKAGRTEPLVFIGHGRTEEWKRLRDHLRDEHGFRVLYFESASRAGRSIRDVLDEMKGEASCAILVYAGEDKLENGKLHPRLNVVHECGFFAAGLRPGRTIVLREESVELPTNQAGEIYIEYSTGSIDKIFGSVVAAIHRATIS